MEPPDVEVVEAVDAGGGERGAVVAPDDFGEAAGAEQVVQVGFDAGPADIREALAAEEIATEVVDDGKRVAVGPIAHPETGP